MAGMRWQDGSSSSEVAEMCRVEDLSVKLRQRTPRWFGQVKRTERVGVLSEVGVVRVGGRRPAGRPRKKWSECVEDMKLLGVKEHVTEDRRIWKAVIARPTQS